MRGSETQPHDGCVNVCGYFRRRVAPLFSRHQLDSRAERAQVRDRLAQKGKLLVFKNVIPGTFSRSQGLRHSEESQLAAA